MLVEYKYSNDNPIVRKGENTMTNNKLNNSDRMLIIIVVVAFLVGASFLFPAKSAQAKVYPFSESAMDSKLIGTLPHCVLIGAIDFEYIVCDDIESIDTVSRPVRLSLIHI